MKVFMIITHPLLLTISFMFIMISGEHWGGFYLMYLLLALPHAGIHALVALAGIVILAIGYSKPRSIIKYRIERLLNITGAFCLVLSLSLFFHNDKKGYNNGTFEQVVPQMTLIFYGFLTTVFIIANLFFTGNKKFNGKLSMKA